MNVAAHYKKEKNEKMGKRKAGEEKKQAIDFKKAASFPSTVVQRAARRKYSLYEGSARSNWDPRESQQPFQLYPNGVRDSTITLRRLLIGAVGHLSLHCLPITRFKSPESRESCDVDTSYVEANRCSESGKNMMSLPLFHK